MGIRRIAGRTVCGGCAAAGENAMRMFRTSAAEVLWRSGPTGPEWEALLASLRQHQVPITDALQQIRRETGSFLERYVVFAMADDVVTPEELATFRDFAERLQVPEEIAGPLRERMERHAALQSIREGNLPTRRPAELRLDIGELCHLDMHAAYQREVRGTVEQMPGRIVVTDKKFRFLGHDTGWELGWSKIFNVAARRGEFVHVQASQKRGSGLYATHDPEYASVLIDTVIRINRREILTPRGQRDTRAVPQHVKTQVWQRDGGACVECGATSYLEFDHVIPLSRGGATSVQNLQILCRACNLRKADRL
ncbi:HNH endonuclease [Polymorphospora sp. NPDC050346]|uniref:HNH endonuclease n=1 Tax=Polymorphospora sp. NPDC050346 TaxID=3155780 RepID=UPI0033C8E7E7